MNERSVILVVYAAVLGWYACKWWESEKRFLAWDAAEKADEIAQARRDSEANAKFWASQPAAATSGASASDSG